jgi:hypothetical protein
MAAATALCRPAIWGREHEDLQGSGRVHEIFGVTPTTPAVMVVPARCGDESTLEAQGGKS